MNPTQQQQQPPQPPPQVSTVSSRLPPGVENVVVTYGYYGRPRVTSFTLDPGARRKLMLFSVIMLVFGPLILVFNSICLAMGHYYLAFGYAAGVLYIVTGCLGVWGSKSNNTCAIIGVMVLAIQCTVWSMILVVAVVAAIIIAAVVESSTVVTIVLEVLLAMIGIIGGTLCLAVSVRFCKATRCLRYAVPGGAGACCGQQVIVYGQQQQLPGQPVGPPAYSTVNPAASQQRQLQDPSSSALPSYDNIAADYRDKV